MQSGFAGIMVDEVSDNIAALGGGDSGGSIRRRFLDNKIGLRWKRGGQHGDQPAEDKA
jgi:hypothetical protein